MTDVTNWGMDIKASRSADPNDVVQTKGQAGKAGDSGAQGFYAQILSTNVEAHPSLSI